jgi:heme A synthase
MLSNQVRPSRLYTSLALLTALLTIGLITFGAVVRVTDSGLGCGDHWPLCHGTIFPPLDNLTAWIEWLHRLFAMLIGVLGIGMLVLAVRGYRKHNRIVLGATVVAALLYTTVAMLGRFIVKNQLSPTLVTLHLGVAMLLLATFILAALSAAYRPVQHYRRDGFTALAYVTAALAFVIILTGALVRGSGATLACASWPLCNGDVLPAGQGQLALVHMFHRYAVVALGVSLALLVWKALTTRAVGRSRQLAIMALAAYGAQAGVGAMVVFSGASALWGAGHVLFAALTWASLVTLSVIETMNSRETSGETDNQWQQKSEPILS